MKKKIKPLAHKNENTFRFQTFSERLSKINAGVIHQIGRTTGGTPEESRTFFSETLEKWVDLNYTEDFNALHRDLGREVYSLAQLIFHQERIVEILTKHVQASSHALPAVLELLVSLARDLQADFYPHFPRFFSLLLDLLIVPDPELLENVFSCLAFLFKILWKSIVQDIKKIFRLYSPLLSAGNKAYVRNFAAESFAFIIRKVPDKRKIFHIMLKNLKNNPSHSVGTGQLLFEVMKGVKNQFHSCTENVLTVILEMLGKSDESSLSVEPVRDAVLECSKSMAKHASPEHCTVIWKVFTDVLQKFQGHEMINEEKNEYILAILMVFVPFVEVKEASLLQEPLIIFKVMVLLLKMPGLSILCVSKILDIFAIILQSELVSVNMDKIVNLFSELFKMNLPIKIFCQFVKKTLFKYLHSRKELLSMLMNFCEENATKCGCDLMDVLSCLTIYDFESYDELEEPTTTSLSLNFQPTSQQPSYKVIWNDRLQINTSGLYSMIQENLQIPSGEKLTQRIPTIWAALLCLPYCKEYIKNKDTVESVLQLLHKVHNILTEEDSKNSVKVDHCAFLLKEIIALALKTDSERLFEKYEISSLLDLLQKFPTSVPVLQSSVIYLKHLQKLKGSQTLNEHFGKMYDMLKSNLASPQALVRRLTLQIFVAFGPGKSIKEDNKEVPSEDKNDVFHICLQAEVLNADVHNIRQKLMWLQRLEYNYLLNVNPLGLYKDAPVYYLLGCLYVNFSLLWTPVQELLKSHAENLGKLFWDIYIPNLQTPTSDCEKLSASLVVEDDGTEDSLTTLFKQNFSSQCLKGNHEPDMYHYRNLLWKTMELFSHEAEARNRDLVPIFLDFVKNECSLVDFFISSKEDIRKFNDGKEVTGNLIEETSDKPIAEPDLVPFGETNTIIESGNDCAVDKPDIAEPTPMVEDEEENSGSDSEELVQHTMELCGSVNEGVGNDPETKKDAQSDEKSNDVVNEESILDASANPDQEFMQEPEEENVSPAVTKQRKAMAKSLCSFLSVFSLFKNPRALYRESEVHDLYLKILSHPDGKVQKLAFDCVLTYGDKYLNTYKQNFYNLLNNKTFKTEIVLFSLDSEFGVIDKNDREKVLPILMRILYGKMLSKTGANTSGRGNALLRRSIVFRFLGGCTANELKFFFELIFAPFQDLKLDALDIVRSVPSSVNLSSVIPLKQQISLMNTLDIIFLQLGNLATDTLPWMLKIVLAMITSSTVLLDQRDQIFSAYIPLIRRLRALGVKRLVQFFTIFDNFPYTVTEIDAIFEAAVWPQLPRLLIEGQTNSSLVLKLFSVWSSNPRYFPLLGKFKVLPDGSTSSVLSELLKLYISPKTNASVINLISRILENMLTLQNVSEESTDEGTVLSEPRIHINCEAEIHYSPQQPAGDLNYGTLLLLPYVSPILQRLQYLVEKALKNSSRLLSNTELTILSRISELVTDAEQSAILVKMLILFLSKAKRRNQNQEAECATLSTIRNLCAQVEEPVKFIRSLSGLFFSIGSRQSRTLLCSILETISQKSQTFLHEASIIRKLNAWNPKLLEEPDYSERMKGFHETEAYLKCDANEHFQNFVLLLIQNCSFFIIHVEDPAIRDNASFSLQNLGKILAPLMTKNAELFRLLVSDTLLDKVKKGMCNKKEIVRHEFIQILSSFLLTCGTSPVLQGLTQLCNEDIETDFWENIRHIQFHRRSRVMCRLSRSLQDGTLSIPHASLSSYVLPLVSSFLYEETYSKNSSLVDAAIELIGSICAQLPWKRYKISLMYYLGLLSKNSDQTKTTIKVLVAILDAFHFDLTKSTAAKEVNEIGMKANEIYDKNSSKASLENSASMKASEIEKATNILDTIAKQLLPRLHSCLTQKTRRDEDHKVNKTEFPEDNEILRIPIALAMVKLLQKLPQAMISQNLPGIFLKVVQFLRSRADSIRTTARETLSKIMLSVGPKYLLMLLHQMKCSLMKGYQAHVMVYTVHTVLTSMIPVLSVGDLDNCISLISELCIEEIFEDMAEEKEVDKIVRKVKEARSSKSFAIYYILGQYVSEAHLEKLVSPLVKVLSSIHNQKKVHKAEECFRQILLGITKNDKLSGRSLLIFAYPYVIGTLDEKPKKPKKVISDKQQKHGQIFLIPTEPPRGGFAAKSSMKTNSHVLVEFGLQVLRLVLKRKKITTETESHLELLNPFVSIVSNYLSSQNVKIITASLSSASCLIKFPLPALKELIGKIMSNVFVLLNRYSGPGMGQGENFEMVIKCFKLLSATLQDVPYFELTPEQLRVLLIYIDQDVHDQTRQATAFTLLKAIISRRVESPELTDVIKKISNMAIVSEQEHIRTQSRQVMHLYMLEYPLKNVLTNHLSFFVVQLRYDYEDGRISALEMLNTIFTTFPENTLRKHAGLFFVPLSASLVNDSSFKCRQMSALCIKNLLMKLNEKSRSSLFTAVTTWLNDRKVMHQRLGAQLLGIFAETEQQNFDKRLKTVLPIIKERLDPKHYTSENESETIAKDLDNLLYQMLSSMIKVASVSKELLTEPEHQPEMNTIWGFVQQHLLHGHTWVQLASCQLFGLLFAANPVETFVSAYKRLSENQESTQNSFLLDDPKQKLRSLSSDFCSQLSGSCISDAHSEQVVRNLVYIAKLIRRFPGEIREHAPEVPVSIKWIFHRLRREVKTEIIHTPASTIKRKSVIKWLAAVAVDMSKEEVQELLQGFLQLLVRESSDNSNYTDPQLKSLAQEVSDLLKSLVGLEVFTREFIQAQSFISKKKAKRKIEKAVQAVKDPVLATRQKIKKNLKKADSRKRKQELYSGHPAKSKKPKLSDLAVFS